MHWCRPICWSTVPFAKENTFGPNFVDAEPEEVTLDAPEWDSARRSGAKGSPESVFRQSLNRSLGIFTEILPF